MSQPPMQQPPMGQPPTGQQPPPMQQPPIGQQSPMSQPPVQTPPPVQTNKSGQNTSQTNIKQFETRANRLTLYYIAGAMLAILVLGFVAGVVNDVLRDNVSTNVFVDNAKEILTVIASTAPWITFFIILCTSWIIIADRLFVRWNRGLSQPNDPDKGVIYEIVHDNNSAAAIVLMVPMIIIALGLIYVALLNLPYNLPTIVTPIR